MLCFGFTSLYAQEGILSTGGNTSNSDGSMSSSIGQVMYVFNADVNGSIAEGVQQPYEISALTGTEYPESTSLKIVAYPNPTTGLLKLQVENDDGVGLMYYLFHTDGHLLESNSLRGEEAVISLSGLVPATYFLKIINDKKEVKTFKIIKTK